MEETIKKLLKDNEELQKENINCQNYKEENEKKILEYEIAIKELKTEILRLNSVQDEYSKLEQNIKNAEYFANEKINHYEESSTNLLNEIEKLNLDLKKIMNINNSLSDELDKARNKNFISEKNISENDEKLKELVEEINRFFYNLKFF